MDGVEVDGRRIAFRRAGSGPPLVLLHGGLSDSRDWSPQLASLSDAFDVVAWDAPGCGGSADPPAGWSAADFGAALAGFMAALGLDRPHVLGLSWGSVLALELWRGHPEVPPVAEVGAEWAATLLSPAATPAMVEASVAGLADVHPAGTRVMLEAFAWADYRPVLPTITVPTLFLHGAMDVRAPLESVRAMRRQVRDAQLVVLPGAGHLPNVEVPAMFDAAVRGFLR